MKIDRLTISNFRGVNGTLNLEPSGENVVLVGPNGCGKSSIIAAVDFLLTGSIQELSGEGSGSLSEKRHGPHVDANPKDSWVEAEFEVDGERIAIKRTMERRSDPVVTDGADELPAEFQSMATAADRGLHLLTRDELLDFITAQAGTRSDRIRKLLDLRHLKSRRLALGNAADTFETETKRLEREASSKRDELYAAVDADRETDDLLQEINERRGALDGDALATLNDGEFRDGIQSPGERVTSSPLLRSKGRQFIDQLQEWFESGVDEFLEVDRAYRETWKEIEADEEAVAALERRQFIERGRAAIEPDEERCPLCHKPWDSEDLRDLLDDRLEQASTLKSSLEDIEPQRDVAQQALTDVRTGGESLLEAVEEVEEFDESPLESFIEAISEWEDGYDGDLLDSPPKSELEDTDRRAILLPESLKSLLDSLQSYIDDQPQLDELESAWSDLDNAESRYDEMISTSRQAMAYRDVANEMRTVHELFLEARDDVLEQIYDDIEEEFETFYTAIHEDEESFSIDLTPTQTSLDLEVEFFDRGEFPPHALHSEGHQDSMGICLFFALCKWLKEQEGLSLMLLDDVVMSIDASHRRPLAKMLAEDLANEFQLFVTTHDDLWHRHLKSAGVVSSSGAVQFSGWDIEDGPQILHRPEMEWETIEQHLEDGNTSIAAHQTRRMAEWYLREACDRLDGKVVFKANSEWSLGDFKQGVVPRYKNLIKKAKNAENTWGRDTSELTAAEQRLKDIAQRLDEDGAGLNPNVHWNETESEFAHCTPEELELAVQAYRDLYEELWCETCNSCIRIIKEGNTPVSVRCICGNTNMNLQSK